VRVAAGAGVGRRRQDLFDFGVVQRIVELCDRDGPLRKAGMLVTSFTRSP
jgi:hypothetical protein